MDVGDLHYRHWLIALKENGDTREISFRSCKILGPAMSYVIHNHTTFNKSPFPTGPNGTAYNHDSSSGHLLK